MRPPEALPAAPAPPRPRRLSWLLVDAGLLVLLGGAGAAVVASAHAQATAVVSQSAVVVAPSRWVTAPAAGTVSQVAPAAVDGASVARGQRLFTLSTAAGSDVGVDAPTAGTLAQVAVAPGQSVAAGSPLATLVPWGAMRVVAMVPETRVRDVHVGQKATVVLPADPGAAFDGRVLAIWPQTAQAYIGQVGMPAPPAQEFLKQTALVPVLVSLGGQPRGLAAGESAEVTIHVGS